MLNGIYSIQFSSSTTRDSGTGTAVFVNDKVYGGDQSYYYKGPVQIEGDNLSAQIRVIRHQPGESIFGPLREFTLQLSGNQGGGTLDIQGNVVEHPNFTIRIRGRKVSEL
ncbi:MAG TPA: GrlR family regulatory protein [Pyrinomonadaceae bacterium]